MNKKKTKKGSMEKKAKKKKHLRLNPSTALGRTRFPDIGHERLLHGCIVTLVLERVAQCLDHGRVHTVKHTLCVAPGRKTGNALGTATDLVRRAARGLVTTVPVETGKDSFGYHAVVVVALETGQDCGDFGGDAVAVVRGERGEALLDHGRVLFVEELGRIYFALTLCFKYKKNVEVWRILRDESYDRRWFFLPQAWTVGVKKDTIARTETAIKERRTMRVCLGIDNLSKAIETKP